MQTQATHFLPFKFYTVKLELMSMAAPSFSSSILRTNPPIASPAHRRVFSVPSSIPRTVTVKCSSSENSEQFGQNGSLRKALSGVVDAQIEELLKKDENKVLLQGLDEASQRVEVAKMKLAEIDRQELEGEETRNEYIAQLEARASELEISQREIIEARSMIEEAERSLSQYVDETPDGVTGNENEEIDRDRERLESVKAASISALVGTVAGLPIYLTQVSSSTELILPLAISFISCALFGVTFRYSVRRNLDNVQLKTGTSAAFGFVKGLGALGAGPPLVLNAESILSHAFNGAVYVSENVVVFLFASVALDFCFKARLVSPFPAKKIGTKDRIELKMSSFLDAYEVAMQFLRSL